MKLSTSGFTHLPSSGLTKYMLSIVWNEPFWDEKYLFNACFGTEWMSEL